MTQPVDLRVSPETFGKGEQGIGNVGSRDVLFVQEERRDRAIRGWHTHRGNRETSLTFQNVNDDGVRPKRRGNQQAQRRSAFEQVLRTIRVNRNISTIMEKRTI